MSDAAPPPWPTPTEPGFYWRRTMHFGDTAPAGWRWAPAEVYRRGGELETNGHALGAVTWGPKITPPPGCPPR